MDKSWIAVKDRTDPVYLLGVDKFLEFAYANKPLRSKIYCPCKKCANLRFETRDGVRAHCIWNGFSTNYTRWTIHGESLVASSSRDESNVSQGFDGEDDMVGLVHDRFGVPRDDGFFKNETPQRPYDGPDEKTKKFFKLLADAERELYPNCKKFTTLSFIVRLMHLKVLNGWTDTSFDMLLQLFKEALPEGETLPKSYYEARKFRDALGFGYDKYDACPKDCMLFWKDKIGLKECSICGRSRYKESKVRSDDGSAVITQIPAKQVRHFPVKPRLQSLFMLSETGSLMKWHDEERNKDDILRHPADSPAWKSFDAKYPDFASDSRNVRLGLAADGFNPFRTMTISHSTWPVVMMPYNLPPWLCMKQSHMLLTLLIDGPRAPGNSIDVYMEPVIEELEELWVEGILTYDASSNQMFQMRAALLWTISDFPAYANLSGWSTKGALACPCCNKDTDSRWLKHSRKFCYMGHRRFLDEEHPFRDDNICFDGSVETRPMPPHLSGDDIFKQVEFIKNKFGERAAEKGPKRRKTGVEDGSGVEGIDERPKYNWKKRSIFFQLPYWKDLLLRHNLDVMHIEKNVCDNILHTLLDVRGKTKDNIKARRDLVEMGIRYALHPQDCGNGKVFLPPTCYTMDLNHKDIFCKVLRNVRVPDGYASNISRRVQERTISGLKSHDCHVILQQLLPLAIRRALPNNVCATLIELSNFFRLLSSKALHPDDFDRLETQIRLTLCHLEKMFLAPFFDIMEHLPVHLAEEARIGGPVSYRCMYFVERYLLTLKKYVRNRTHPEGSIAEGYLSEECLTFCARYLHGVETKLNRPTRNYEGEQAGRSLGKGTQFLLDNISYQQAHKYVIGNDDEVAPFREKHMELLRSGRLRLNERELVRRHNEEFSDWFREHVHQLQGTGNAIISHQIKLLSEAPDKWARRYSGYIINGVRYHTKQREERRITQNSGVCLCANTQSYACARDRCPISGDVTYYGVLRDVVELRYSNDLKFVLFKCDWIDNNVGKKQDQFKFTLVNFKHLMYKQNRVSDEPFILASQAQQVWYVEDPIDEDWKTVVKMTPRDFYHGVEKEFTSEDGTLCPQVEPYSDQTIDENMYTREEDVNWVRSDAHGIEVDNIDDDGGVGGSLGSEDEEMDDSYYKEDACDNDDDSDDSIYVAVDDDEMYDDENDDD